jgi:hypothetical protein
LVAKRVIRKTASNFLSFVKVSIIIFRNLYEENVSLLVDTYQNSVPKKENLEAPLVILVSNLYSKLHSSGTLENVFVSNLS